jgi:hypothetical protein
MPRANAYLAQAIASLRAYHEMLDETGTAHAWSALYKALTNLLGNELTHLLRKTDELTQDYVYVGSEYCDVKTTEDHVVPLTCIIKRLQECSAGWPSGSEGVKWLRGFMGEHLVIARIPKTLNRKLAPSKMPNDDWWRPVGPAFDYRQKQKALWGRYASENIRVVIPCYGDSDFKLAEKRQPKRSRPG